MTVAHLLAFLVSALLLRWVFQRLPDDADWL